MTLPPNWQPPASFVKDGVTWTVGREVGDGVYECYRMYGARIFRTFEAWEIHAAERSE